MKEVSYNTTRLATALFFATPGIGYGLFTSRLPYLKVQVGANESEVGIMLFALGLAAALGLAVTPSIVKKIPIKVVLPIGLVTTCVALIAASLSINVLMLTVSLATIGLAMGVLDVAMNMQGVAIEVHYAKPTLGVLHASYSFGGVLGSVLGSVFAALGLSPLPNFLIPVVFLLIAGYFATTRLIDRDPPKRKEKKKVRTFTLLLLCCGIFSLVGYVAEGICGDWGSLFLAHERSAPESSAALAYGVIASTCFLSRLVADRMRLAFGDFKYAFVSALIFTSGVALVIHSSSWLAALIGFAIGGIGLGPLVPILFSFAGRLPGVDPNNAIATVSFMGYVGLLAFPPVFGFIAHHYCYEGIFYAQFALALLCILFTFLFKGEKKEGSS